MRDEEERKKSANEYASAMSDWRDFCQTTSQVYGVEMTVLDSDFEREQKEYYLLSSRWAELRLEVVLAEPAMIKQLDMMTCTLEDSKGIPIGDEAAKFDFEICGDEVSGPISGVAGWFTADFRSRTDEGGMGAPKLLHPSYLSTGPENDYTHWGQQVFYFLSSIPILKGEITRLNGEMAMMRTKENARLYNCRIAYTTSRRRGDEPKDGTVLMKSARIVQVYQIP
jgi:protein arginine N-methyltransferase 1